MKIYFASFGCKVNSSEDEYFLSRAMEMGYSQTRLPEHADVIVINGCAVTETAAERCKGYIRKISSRFPEKKLIVTGCIASGNEAYASLSPASFIPNGEKNMVIKEIAEFAGKNLTGKYDISAFCGGSPDINGGHTRAFLKIQDGCDACCSYCIIPALRGAPVSLPIGEAVKEFRKCVEKGFKEIVLVGIHVGLYGRGEGYSLNNLIKETLKIPGDFRIRLSSIEINEIDEELISLISGNEKLCNHLHIPLQSGSDKILKNMGRKYNAEKYIKTVKTAKSKIKGLTVGSDVITGFPGETEKEFLETIETIKSAGTDFLHVFPYSDRNGTPASVMKGKISETEKERRAKELRALAQRMLRAAQEKYLGKTLRVLTEKDKKGHSSNYFRVYLKSSGEIPPNNYYNVKIDNIEENALSGHLYL